jgi:hypothetical protein
MFGAIHLLVHAYPWCGAYLTFILGWVLKSGPQCGAGVVPIGSASTLPVLPFRIDKLPHLFTRQNVETNTSTK